MTRGRRRLAWLTPCCLLAAGCGRDYDEAARVVARGPVPLKDCRFEDAPAFGAGRRSDPRTGAILGNHRSLLVGTDVHTIRLRVSGEAAVVYTRPDGAERELETWTSGPDRREGFDAVTFKGAVVVLLAIDQVLVQMVGHQTGSPVLAFSPPVIVRSGPGLAVTHPCLASSGSRLHAIWLEGGPAGASRLAYAGTDDPESEWSAPRYLCETANWAPAAVAADGDDVYVAWSDRRFLQDRLFREDNSAKAFVVRSTDGGGTFGMQVLLDDRADRWMETFSVRLAFAGEDLIMIADDRRNPLDFVGARLARDLSTLTVLGPVSRQDIHSAQDSRLRARRAAAAAPRLRPGAITWTEGD